ncbi:MAG: hypothetical protein QXM43_02965 [Desulfurococcaceae archaeon]
MRGKLASALLEDASQVCNPCEQASFSGQSMQAGFLGLQYKSPTSSEHRMARKSELSIVDFLTRFSALEVYE